VPETTPGDGGQGGAGGAVAQVGAQEDGNAAFLAVDAEGAHEGAVPGGGDGRRLQNRFELGPDLAAGGVGRSGGERDGEQDH
jgi:hypothetical protein